MNMNVNALVNENVSDKNALVNVNVVVNVSVNANVSDVHVFVNASL